MRVVERPGEGLIDIEIDGWRLTVQVDAEGLVQCLRCQTGEGGDADLSDWPRYGTNPTDLLSIWERGRIEQLLAHT